MTILLNPKNHDRYYPDDRSREIMLKTIEFFENKGKARIKEDDHKRVWYSDFIEFQKNNKIFAQLLTPSQYGENDNSRLYNPADNSQVFSWYITRIVDKFGNQAAYEYEEILLGLKTGSKNLGINPIPQKNTESRKILNILVELV